MPQFCAKHKFMKEAHDRANEPLPDWELGKAVNPVSTPESPEAVSGDANGIQNRRFGMDRVLLLRDMKKAGGFLHRPAFATTRWG